MRQFTIKCYNAFLYDQKKKRKRIIIEKRYVYNLFPFNMRKNNAPFFF